LANRLALAVREAGISNSQLARFMRLGEKEARRILDPHYNTAMSLTFN
jgi:hypothetical protein